MHNALPLSLYNLIYICIYRGYESQDETDSQSQPQSGSVDCLLRCILTCRCFDIIQYTIKHIRSHSSVHEKNTMGVLKYLHAASDSSISISTNGGLHGSGGGPNGRELDGHGSNGDIDQSTVFIGEVYHSVTWVLTSSDLLSQLMNSIVDAAPVTNYGDCAKCCSVLACAIQSGLSLLLCYHDLVTEFKIQLGGLSNLSSGLNICNHGTLCVRKLFDLWGQCMLHEKRYVNQIRRRNGAGAATRGGGYTSNSLLKYANIRNDSSSSSSCDANMQCITNCIVQVTHMLCNNNNLSSVPTENASGRYAFDITSIASDYILSIYIRQCSTGQLLYFLNKESVNAVTLRSPITPEQGVLIYGFHDQDNEINGFNGFNGVGEGGSVGVESNIPNYVRVLLQSLCQLFVQVCVLHFVCMFCVLWMGPPQLIPYILSIYIYYNLCLYALLSLNMY